MEAVLIVLFSVFGASLVTLIILLLTLKAREPGKTVVVIKDKRKKEPEKAKKVEEKPQKQDDELKLTPTYCSILFDCDKCGKKFFVQEQNLEKDIICPKCKEEINKQEHFKKVLKAELKSQTKEQELFLGMSYLYGVGVKKDDKKAYLFVNLSAYNGDVVAKEMLKGYYSEEIAKLTKENIKDATGDKLEDLIKEQKLQYNKEQFEPKTINELHNFAIDYFWWATYHRMNSYDVDELATVGGASINSNRILNMAEGFEEVDLSSLESRLAFAYLDIAAKNGRYDLYAELGFAYVGFDNDKAKYYLQKGIECGDEKCKELYAVYFEGKTIDQVRIEKLTAPREVILLEQKSKGKIKSADKKEAKETKATAVEEKKAEIEVSVDEMFDDAVSSDQKEDAVESKPLKEEKEPEEKKDKKDKKAKEEKKEKKSTVVKKTKSKKETSKADNKTKEEVLQEIKEKSLKTEEKEEKKENQDKE